MNKQEIRKAAKIYLERFLFENYEDEELKGLTSFTPDEEDLGDDPYSDDPYGEEPQSVEGEIISQIMDNKVTERTLKNIEAMERRKDPSFKIITDTLVKGFQQGEERVRNAIYAFFYTYYTRENFLNMVARSPHFAYRDIQKDVLARQEIVATDLSQTERGMGQIWNSLEAYQDKGATITAFIVNGLKQRSLSAKKKSHRDLSMDAPIGGDSEGNTTTIGDRIAADAGEESSDEQKAAIYNYAELWPSFFTSLMSSEKNRNYWEDSIAPTLPESADNKQILSHLEEYHPQYFEAFIHYVFREKGRKMFTDEQLRSLKEVLSYAKPSKSAAEKGEKGKPTPHRWTVFQKRFLQGQKFFNIISDTEDWASVKFDLAGKSYLTQYILLPYFAQKGITEEDVLKAFKLKGAKKRIEGVADGAQYNVLLQTAQDDPGAVKLLKFLGEDVHLGHWAGTLSTLINKMVPYETGGLKTTGKYEGKRETIPNMQKLVGKIEQGFARPAYADIVNQLSRAGMTKDDLPKKSHTKRNVNESEGWFHEFSMDEYLSEDSWFHEFSMEEYLGEESPIDGAEFSERNALSLNESAFNRWKKLAGIK